MPNATAMQTFNPDCHPFGLCVFSLSSKFFSSSSVGAVQVFDSTGGDMRGVSSYVSYCLLDMSDEKLLSQ